MTPPKTYQTPAGFKVALEDRLKKRASLRGTVVNRVRQRFVMERFLARIARTFGSTVTLKGGLALELRLANARSTKDIDLRTVGDLEVDAHHTVEDTALALGQALREALGDKAGIRRFGDALVPLDEALVQAAVDLSGRPYVVHVEPEVVELIGTYDTSLTRHIWESISASAQICLHVRVLEGRNAHHVVEAQFKAVARALRDAVALDARVQGVPSTKGAL